MKSTKTFVVAQSNLNNRSNVTLTADDASLARELIQFAVEELREIVMMAEQRRHEPLGMRAYVDSAVALLARMQVH